MRGATKDMASGTGHRCINQRQPRPATNIAWLPVPLVEKKRKQRQEGATYRRRRGVVVIRRDRVGVRRRDGLDADELLVGLGSSKVCCLGIIHRCEPELFGCY